MRKLLVLVIAVLIIGGISYMFRGQPTEITAAQAAASTTLPAVQDIGAVIVEGEVVPQQSVDLAFATTGLVVAEVFVAEGTTVKAGEPIAQLDPRQLELNIEQAKVNVLQAQANYDKLEEGATPEEISAAEAQVAEARARLQQTNGSVTQSDLAAAQAQVQSARAALRQLEAGPRTSEVTAARATLQQARAQLAKIDAGPQPADLRAAEAALDQARTALALAESGPKEAELQAAQALLDQALAEQRAQAAALSTAKSRAHSQMTQAADDVRLAQVAYSAAYWDDEQARQGRNPRTGNSFGDDNLDETAQQRVYADALDTAALKLQQAKLAYEEAHQAEINGIAAANARVSEASAGLDRVRTSVDAGQISAAQAQVAQAEARVAELKRIDPAARSAALAQIAQAEANLDKLLNINPSDRAAARAQVVQAEANLARLQGDERQGSVQAASAGVENAQAQLDQVTAGVGTSDLAGARAQVEQAKVQVKQAELALEQATLRSPISGTIAELNLEVGEVPGAAGAAVVVADMTIWRIETTDLTELQIVTIADGASVTITFDALPGVELPGTVTQIKPIGENKQGDITYTVVVTPDQQDARLRWNMTAAVAIQPE